MGTRNLTCVYVNGIYKVAQYGQWDGYPEGAGITCLHFLQMICEKQNILDRFLYKVKQMKFLSDKDVDIIIDGCKANNVSWQDYVPEFCRDTGADILNLIDDEKIRYGLVNNINFAADSLMCEWCYVIDFDKNVFEVYEGFNKEPLTENDRFNYLKIPEYNIENKYYPVKLVASWDLRSLPTDEEFLETFKEKADE